MSKTVYYLAYFNDPAITREERYVSRAATTKVEYIASCLNSIDFKVDIVSPAEASGKSGFPVRFVELSQGVSLQLFGSLGRASVLGKVFNKLYIGKQLKKFLKSIGKNDVLVCYHMVDYIDMLVKQKKEKQFRLILEVEEVYSDVNNSAALREREQQIFDVADAFIFSAELLSHRIDMRGRPYCVCSGIYSANPKLADKRKDGRIHVVYAGTLDSRKGGAMAAIAAGTLLDKNYAMHILGNGNGQQVADIKNAVTEANKISAGCTISYDGFKSGQEFNEFIQSCHIGLSPQDPDAAFNQTSFPSKVFMYLSNGLQVVSVDLPVFTDEMRKQLTLCSSNAESELANAIRQIDTDMSESQSAIGFLERENGTFCSEVSKLIKSVATSE